MKVYTKTGDEGVTSLFTGERIEKDSPRVEVYGTVDEINSALAMARSFSNVEEIREKIFELQKILPRLMADLASLNGKKMLNDADISKIEQEIDFLEEKLPPLKNFVIPGDTKAGACLDLARTITRRAERKLYKLSRFEEISETDRIFINRLSDYLFMLMRTEDYFAAKKSAVLV
ncbi:MAG: cob(I)yrinic acid a,c-diamide adenosyltransferase [Selenomonadaceae bacterium]|nr:cob(I)yrinic acid a,c-diamide adenosyltransferase [Selenomonadaceae bacterium]